VELAGKNFASNQQLDESTASLAKAKAELELKRAEPGEIIGPGKPVITLEADSQFWFARARMVSTV
jgi:HlyD family secretion protein